MYSAKTVASGPKSGNNGSRGRRRDAGAGRIAETARPATRRRAAGDGSFRLFARTLFHAAVILALPAAAQSGPAQPPLEPIRCLIEPQEMVQLSTPVAGIVAEVNVDRGDIVHEGDVLARLDSRVEEITLALARQKAMNETRINSLEAKVAFLADKAERLAQLAARSAVSESDAHQAAMEAEMAREDLAEARLNADLARLEAEQAEVLLAQKTVRAPFDGVITERLLAPGEFRDTQAPILAIARIDVLKVEAFAPLAYYGSLSLGQTVTIRPEAPVGGAYAATITVIDRVFDAATATFGIRMALPNPALSLPAGLRCDVEFTAPPLPPAGN